MASVRERFDPSDGGGAFNETIAAMGFQQAPVAQALADPNRPDCPLTHVNAAFTQLTGYPASEVVGRNCRFLQGPGTDPHAAAMIATLVAERREGYVELLNYRRDRTPFWNGLRLSPVRDGNGRVVAICATQSDVSELHAARSAGVAASYRERETTHRIKNAFQAIESMVKLSGRRSGSPRLVEKIATRVRAIATAHATSLAQPHLASVPMLPVVRDVLDAHQGVSGNRIGIEGPVVNLFPATVSILALVLNELASNATAHGSLSRPTGKVSVAWSVPRADLGEDAEVALTWRETDGPRALPPRTSGEGTATIERLLLAAGGRIERIWGADGLNVRVVLPRER